MKRVQPLYTLKLTFKPTPTSGLDRRSGGEEYTKFFGLTLEEVKMVEPEFILEKDEIDNYKF